MLVTEFAKKYKLRKRDIIVATKVYGTTEMSEQQWFDKLKKEFSFQDEEVLRKVREAKEKKSTKAKSTKQTKKVSNK